MTRTVFMGGRIFDGTGAPPAAGQSATARGRPRRPVAAGPDPVDRTRGASARTSRCGWSST